MGFGEKYFFESSNGKEYRRSAIKAAKELGYGKDVIEKLKNSKSDIEVTNILKDARIQSIEKDIEDCAFLREIKKNRGAKRETRS